MILKLLMGLAVGLAVFYAKNLLRGMIQRSLDQSDASEGGHNPEHSQKGRPIAPAEDLAHCKLCERHVPKSVAEGCESPDCPMKAYFNDKS